MNDKFAGFDLPNQNWSKLPHQFIQALPIIETLAEMKVILYILRHTWGFSEFGAPKKITTDEFQKGRKRRDGSRMDAGIRMGKQAIRDGLARAEQHGFIKIAIDDSDAGRIEKSYVLAMSVSQDTQGDDNHPPNHVGLYTQGDDNHPPEGWKSSPGGRKSPPRGMKITPRTEKETLERNPKKETEERGHGTNNQFPSLSIKQLWGQALRDLELSTDPAVFSQIEAAKIRSNGDDVCPSDTATIILSYRSPLTAEWMRERMSEHIEEALSAVAGEEVRVEFVAREEIPA